MKSSKRTLSNMFVNCPVLTLCVVALWLISSPPAFSETLGEATTTMELQGELMNVSEQTPNIAPKLANDVNQAKKMATPKIAEAAEANAPEANDINATKGQPQQVAAEKTADTNAPAPDINDFNDYKQEINRIDIEARVEDSKWLGRLERKTELAKAMDDVVVAELRFLRKLAEAEKDLKTVDAIDLVLKRRQERLAKLIIKIEDEAKPERRVDRRPPRMGGAGEPGQTERRTQRRTRDTNSTTQTTQQQQQY